MAQDYFETNDSDGDLGHFVGLVDNSIWSNPDIESKGKADFENSDRYQLYWYTKVLDILQEDFDDDTEDVTVTMSIGKDWLPEGDGDDIRHKDDPGDDAVERGEAKPILFSGAPRRGSVYGKYLTLTRGANDNYYTSEGEAEILDGGDEIEIDLVGIRNYFRKQGITDPRKASIWNGHVFLFRGLGLKYNRDQKPRLKALPVKWLGTLEDYEAQTGVSVKTEGGVTKVGGTAEAENVATTLPTDTAPEVVEMLTQVVNSSSSHTEFMKTALKLPEVRGNEDLTSAIMNEAEGPWSAKV